MELTSQNRTGLSWFGRVRSFFIEFGTARYDATTSRRLRVVNSFALILMITSLSVVLAFGGLLYLDGLSPISGNTYTFLALFALLSVTGLFHRFSDIAAAVYFFVVLTLSIAAGVVVMGKDHGIIYALIGIGTLGPLMCGERKRFYAIMLTAFLILTFWLIETFAPAVGPGVEGRSEEMKLVGRMFAGTFVIVVVFSVVTYAINVAERAERALEAEYARSEMLLRNILPDPIALRLKAEPDELIADRHEGVTVLFADIVGFTPRATQNPPEEVVQLLNRVFSEFDGLVEKYGLEKIKTVGDAYMVVAGIPEPHSDGPAAMANFALELMKKTEEVSEELGDEIEVRVGIHTGDAVAGVIGTRKFAYDIWGDTVNTAARMEAFGVPNRIQVTEAVKKALEDRYSFEERGIVDIKGKGEMELYFLLGQQS